MKISKKSLLFALELLSQVKVQVPVTALANPKESETTKKFVVLLDEINEALKDANGGDTA
jgi:hypothetical protein